MANGLTINGTLTLGNPTLGPAVTTGGLYFSGNQTISGTGSIEFTDQPPSLFDLNYLAGDPAGTLTIDIAIHGQTILLSSSDSNGGYGKLIVDGTIATRGSAPTLTVYSHLTIGPLGQLSMADSTQVTILDVQNYGSIALGSDSTLAVGAQFRGGTMTNAGKLLLGADSRVIQGALTQTSTGLLSVDIGSPPANNQIGRLSLGSATLDGSLTAKYVNGYNPGPAQSYLLINSNQRSGVFSTPMD